jgi:hypothetical protein
MAVVITLGTDRPGPVTRGPAGLPEAASTVAETFFHLTEVDR